MPPNLILLNGAPASGKSTLAARLVDLSPGTLNLDIDVIRAQLDEWPSDPEGAGLAARRKAIADARLHLLAGNSVVVPQLLGRLDFVNELDALADETGAVFREVALQIDRQVAVESFTARSAAAATQSHRDAALLVERSPSDDPLGDMHAAVEWVVAQRPKTHRVAVVPGDIDTTLALLVEVLDGDA